MGYSKQSIKGISWMGAFRFISRIVAFFRIAILARVLMPSQFGVYGIASLILSLLETLTTTGINIFIIQEEKDLDEYIDTAWIVSIIRGILIALVIIALTPLIINFFDAPDARLLLYLVSLVAFIRGFINPSRVRFQKDLEFGKEFWFSGGVLFLDAVVVVVVVIIFRTASSMVWGLVAGASLEVLLSFVLIKPTPKLSFNSKQFKEIITRGRWVTLSGIFSYLFQEGDDAVVGRMMDTAALGNYRMAYKISTLPVTEIAQVTNKVTFPVYSKIAGDIKRLRKAFLKTFINILFITSLMGIIIFSFPKFIVMILLGPNWYDIVPVLRVLSVFGVIRALTNSTNPLFFAVKKQEYVTYISLIGILGMGITIVPLVAKFGIIGAAYSALIGALISLPVAIYYLRKVFE